MSDAADLMLACITALPRSYRVFGADYDAGTSGLDTMEERLASCRSGWHSPRRLRGKSSR